MITFFKNGKISNVRELKGEPNGIPDSNFSKASRNQEFETAWKKIVTEVAKNPEIENQRNLNQTITEETSNEGLKNQMLSEKYQPTHFYELVGNHQVNLDIISWLRLHKEKNLPVHQSFFFPGQDQRVTPYYIFLDPSRIINIE